LAGFQGVKQPLQSKTAQITSKYSCWIYDSGLLQEIIPLPPSKGTPKIDFTEKIWNRKGVKLRGSLAFSFVLY
jgi:hypothetical protein